MGKSKELTFKFGVPLGSILVIIFVLFKLTGNLDWSWWWVFSPIWLPLALFLFIVLIIFIIGIIVAIINK